MPKTQPKQFQFSFLVRTYAWMAYFAVSLAPFLFVPVSAEPGRTRIALGAAIAIQILLWVAREKCSTDNLSWWNGLLYFTSSMTMGVGGHFTWIAILASIFAITASVFIALAGLISGKGEHAPQLFRKLIMLASRNRMYQ